jgi:hypothetical protein
MNFHWPFSPKPAAEPAPRTRYVIATRRESEAARRKRTETHLMLAVERVVLPPREPLPRPAYFERMRGR